MTSTLPPLIQAFSGAIGSAVANGLSYPLDLVTTRLQLDSPRRSRKRGGAAGGLRLLVSIIKKHGVGALYDGLGADTCATLLSNFFYFYIYSFLRMLSVNKLIPFTGHRRDTTKAHKPTLIEEIVLGFIAGVASRAVSTPLNIITLKIQTEREDDSDDSNEEVDAPHNATEIIDIVKLIYKEQGLAGFWRGFQMSALLSLNPSITMGFLQMYRRALGFLKSRSPHAVAMMTDKTKRNIVNHNLHPWEAFFGGAIANSIAVSILYPLILGKKRLQISPSATMRDVIVDAYKGIDVTPHRQHSLSGKDGVFTTDPPQSSEARIQGLYQGYQLKIISGFLSQGVTFLVKGRIEQLIIAAYLARMKRAAR